MHRPRPALFATALTVGIFLAAIASAPNSANADIHNRPTANGSMAGKTIVISAGHGVDTDGTWDRGVVHDLKEDVQTNEVVIAWLQRYLANAGATVHCVRERSFQRHEVIIDNADAGYSETGGWNSSTNADDYRGANYRYHSTTAAAANPATARWTPDIPAAGEYPVYVWYTPGGNRSTAAEYTVRHPGGESRVAVNQALYRGSWIYIGTWFFNAGQNADTGSVTLSSRGDDTNTVVIADAVRFGSGTNTDTHGHPRWMETATLSTSHYGYKNPNGFGQVTIRPRYAGWLTRMNETDQTWTDDWRYLSIHTNAGGGRGTSVFSYSNGRDAAWNSNGPVIYSTALQSASDTWAALLQSQFVSDMRANWEAGWQNRGPHIMNFGELRECRKMPSALIELAFHDDETDTGYIRQERWRHDAARAIYKSFARSFDADAVIVPLPPKDLRVTQTAGGTYTVSWTPVNDPLEASATPTGYKIYRSPDGRSWDEGTTTSDTTITFNGNAGQLVFVRVAATNAGGESIATGALAAKVAAGGNGHGGVLIVDGFDRQFIYKVTDVAGNNDPTNTYERYRDDYIQALAQPLAKVSEDVPFDSTTNDAVIEGFVDLQDYACVIWMLGEESTADETFDATEQAMVKAYLAAGGNRSLMVSGAELGWDLDAKGSASDQSFFNESLFADYKSDDAGTHTVNGSGIFAGLNASFGDGTSGAEGDYDVDYPDVFNTANGSTAVLAYDNGAGAAAVYSDNGSVRVLTAGFPWERILGDAARESAMQMAITALMPDYEAPVGENGGNAPPPGGCSAMPTASGSWFALLMMAAALVAIRRVN